MKLYFNAFIISIFRFYRQVIRPFVRPLVPKPIGTVLVFIRRKFTWMMHWLLPRILPRPIKNVIKSIMDKFLYAPYLRRLEYAMRTGFSKSAASIIQSMQSKESQQYGEIFDFLLAEHAFVSGDTETCRYKLNSLQNSDQSLICNSVYAIRYINLLQAMGHSEYIEEILPIIKQMFFYNREISLIDWNQKLANNSKEHSILDYLNPLYKKNNLEEIEVKDPAIPVSLSNIVSNPKTFVDDDKKISVLMPAYNCGDTIGYAIESILNQSWRNLELIVVNDCSTDNTAEIVEVFCKRDSRVKLVNSDKNQGAYASRNKAYENSIGDYLTVHDTDDWSHCRKFELQIKALRKKPQFPNLTDAIGVTPNTPVQFMKRSVFHNFLCPNFSSLIFNRNDFVEYGSWDEVRFGADSELSARFCRLRNIESPKTTLKGVPLTILAVRSESLTNRSNSSLGTLGYGSRREYINQYNQWHQIELTKNKPFSSKDKRKPFSIPNMMKIKPDSKLQYDVIFITDLTINYPKAEQLIEVIQHCEKNSLKLAVIHIPTFMSIGYQTRDPEAQRLLYMNAIPVLVSGEEASCETLILGDTRLTDFLPDKLPGIRCDRFMIIDDNSSESSFEGIIASLEWETDYKRIMNSQSIETAQSENVISSLADALT